MHTSVYEEAQKFAKTLPADRPLRIGDVGACNLNGCLRAVFEKPPWTYVGMDLSPGPNVDLILASETQWTNVKDGEFDVVVSVSTMEHTRYPWLFMKELARIVKGSGSVFVTAPYMWVFHQHPIDCWRVYPDGMKAVMESVNLRVKSTYMRTFQETPHMGDTVGIAVKP